MTRKNCVYCGKEITQRSSEHIIQNALGGVYESEDICCPECNNAVSRYVDAPFTKIFNPIIGGIKNFSKTNNPKSLQPCTGTVLYQDKTYHANIKAGKVVACPDLSRQLRCDATKLPLKIISYDFNLENAAFQTGMGKIAFNYALDRGIDLSVLKHGMHVQKSGNDVTGISFNYEMFPFCALNPLDLRLELHTPFSPYHCLILFEQNSKLWCYIDLFNTFQYYVLLSDKMSALNKVHGVAAQTVQKIDRTVPDLDAQRPKDLLIFAQQYGVRSFTDAADLAQKIKVAIARKSQKTDLNDIIAPRVKSVSYDYFLDPNTDKRDLPLFGQSMRLYFNEFDRLNTNTFRTMTTCSNVNNVFSYPEAVLSVSQNNEVYFRRYALAKFKTLNYFLTQQNR